MMTGAWIKGEFERLGSSRQSQDKWRKLILQLKKNRLNLCCLHRGVIMAMCAPCEQIITNVLFLFLLYISVLCNACEREQ